MKTKRLFKVIAVLVLALGIVGCTPHGIAGIDYPISVSGVTLKFYSAELSTNEMIVGSHSFSPDPGDYVLVVHGYYTGDLKALYEKITYGGFLFYVSNSQGDKYRASVIQAGESNSNLTIDIGFIVPMTSEPPYILRSDIVKPWSVDITSLTRTLVPTNTPQPPLLPTPLTIYGGSLKRVYFWFDIVTISDKSMKIGGNKDLMTPPDPSYSVLEVIGRFIGNIDSLFSGPFKTSGGFYITDVDNTKYDWTVFYSGRPPWVSMGFYVKRDKAPYILHNIVDVPWSIDLTPMIQNN